MFEGGASTIQLHPRTVILAWLHGTLAHTVMSLGQVRIGAKVIIAGHSYKIALPNVTERAGFLLHGGKQSLCPLPVPSSNRALQWDCLLSREASQLCLPPCITKDAAVVVVAPVSAFAALDAGKEKNWASQEFFLLIVSSIFHPIIQTFCFSSSQQRTSNWFSLQYQFIHSSTLVPAFAPITQNRIDSVKLPHRTFICIKSIKRIN